MSPAKKLSKTIVIVIITRFRCIYFIGAFHANFLTELNYHVIIIVLTVIRRFSVKALLKQKM